MKSPSDDRPDLVKEDEEFVERLAASYAPPAMPPARRVAFDEALRERIARRSAPRRWAASAWVPSAAVAAAVAALWIAFGLSGVDGPPSDAERSTPLLSASAWEEEVFLGETFFESEEGDESELLPEEYLAIASAFLEG
jgi:hypothetical protein